MKCPECQGGAIPVVLCNSSVELPSLKEAKFVYVWGILKIKGDEPMCQGANIDEGRPYVELNGIRVIL